MKFILLGVWTAWEEGTCLCQTCLWLWELESLKPASFERLLTMSQHAFFSVCQYAESLRFLCVSAWSLQWFFQHIGFESLYLLIFESGIFIPKRERIWRNDTTFYSTGSKTPIGTALTWVQLSELWGSYLYQKGFFWHWEYLLNYLVTLWYL